jgi:hypothetical protein
MTEYRLIVAAIASGMLVTAASGQTTTNDESVTAEGIDLRANFADAITNDPVGFDGSMDIQRDEIEPYIYHNGPYFVGYLSIATIIDTDFDGNSGVIDPGDTETILLLDFEQGLGFGAGIGYRFDELAIELYYERMTFDTGLLGSDYDDAIMHSVNLDAKYFFMTDTPLQPHVSLGFILPWLNVNNAAFAPNVGPITQLGKANFRGFGVSIGAGVTYYFTPKIALTGTAGWRQIWYNRVEGVLNQELRPPGGTFDGSGLFAKAGVMISF